MKTQSKNDSIQPPSACQIVGETFGQDKLTMKARLVEGRESPFFGPLLFRFYSLAGSERIRRNVRSLILRLEGGEHFSRTIRRIFSAFYNRDVGLYSGGASLLPMAFPPGPPRVDIGRYTSLSHTMRAFNANHPTDRKSTHAFFYNPALGFVKDESVQRTRLTIGNDVWIGHNAILLASVSSIGDGAVVAAGSVVYQNVPPYAIVAGYPARLMRYRFSPDTIKRLLESRWWDKTIHELLPEFPAFQMPLEASGQGADINATKL